MEHLHRDKELFHYKIWESHIDHHHHLQDLAIKLQAALKMGNTDIIYNQAKHFYIHVTEHMREEESPQGIYSRIESLSPGSLNIIQKLKMQHHEILNTLGAICSEVDERFPTTIKFMDDCLELIIQHEKDEEELFANVLSPMGTQ